MAKPRGMGREADVERASSRGGQGKLGDAARLLGGGVRRTTARGRGPMGREVPRGCGQQGRNWRREPVTAPRSM